MKKIFLLLALYLFCATVFGQNQAEAEKLVEQGIPYHDKGDYEGAIKLYDKALELDKDNLYALAEKAMSQLTMQKYEDAIETCQRAIVKHTGNKNLKNVYVTYGNAYDGLKKTDKSIEVYNEGIKFYPDYYQLYFNKGITLSSVKKYEEAILCFQQSATLNPKHASSQNALGRLLKVTDKRIPSLMALSRFLVLEPESQRAKGNLEILLGLTKGNVEQTGKNSITININANTLGDTSKDGKAKENSFSTTDLILSMETALDFTKENKKKTEVEQFHRKFETMCSSLKESKGKNFGFYWDYYAPYFIEMHDKKLTETFAYIAFAISDYPDVKKWLEKHKKEIEAFYEWSGNYTWPQKK